MSEPFLPVPPPERPATIEPYPRLDRVPPIRVPRNRYVVGYVFPDGGERDDSRHSDAREAFKREADLRDELLAQNYRLFVTWVADSEDPELGTLSVDDYCEDCGGRWTDEDACPSCGTTIENIADRVAAANTEEGH